MTQRRIIGWRERIALPELGISSLKVKTDTGARSSAIHAHIVSVRQVDGVESVEFDLLDKKGRAASRHLFPLFAIRSVKNTSGLIEERYTIKTAIVLGGESWPIQITLTDRAKMKYDMILGRKAIRKRKFLVDPAKSYLAGAPEL